MTDVEGAKYQVGTVDYYQHLLAIAEARVDELEGKLGKLKQFICHEGGLIDEWANEWNPSEPITLTAYIEERLDEAMHNRVVGHIGESDGHSD